MDKNKDIKITGQQPIKDISKEEIEVKTVDTTKPKKTGIYIGALIIILSGILSGYFLSQSNKTGVNIPGATQSGKTVGSEDKTAFPDSAEGTMEEGGINGEGTHKLIRPGGDSQTVYLTSSVIDLDQFAGKKVKVWGQTLTAEKAGWFMDVGRVELLE